MTKYLEQKMAAENFIKLKRNNKSSSSWSLSRLESISETSRTSIGFYYGEAPVGVPFLWESQPGTPKFEFHENPLPPLKPPPASHFVSSMKEPKRTNKLFRTLLPKLSLRKTSSPSSSPAYSSWSSSSSSSSSSSRSSARSVLSSLSSLRGRWLHFSRPKSSSDHLRMEEEEDECAQPVSTLCFGFGRYKYCHVPAAAFQT